MDHSREIKTDLGKINTLRSQIDNIFLDWILNEFGPDHQLSCVFNKMMFAISQQMDSVYLSFLKSKIQGVACESVEKPIYDSGLLLKTEPIIFSPPTPSSTPSSTPPPTPPTLKYKTMNPTNLQHHKPKPIDQAKLSQGQSEVNEDIRDQR